MMFMPKNKQSYTFGGNINIREILTPKNPMLVSDGFKEFGESDLKSKIKKINDHPNNNHFFSPQRIPSNKKLDD